MLGEHIIVTSEESDGVAVVDVSRPLEPVLVGSVKVKTLN